MNDSRDTIADRIKALREELAVCAEEVKTSLARAAEIESDLEAIRAAAGPSGAPVKTRKPRTPKVKP